jgi:hypothetical protein
MEEQTIPVMEPEMAPETGADEVVVADETTEDVA